MTLEDIDQIIIEVDDYTGYGNSVFKVYGELDAFDASGKQLKYGGDEFITILNKFDGKTADRVLELYQRHGDSFVEIFLKYSDAGVEVLTSKHGREAIDVIAGFGDDGIKALKYNDELLSNYSKLDNIEKFAEETAALAKELNCTGGKFTPGNYLSAMKKSFGWEATKKLGDSIQAHHIFPKAYFGEGKRYEDLLKDVGISYCDPRLLSWYDTKTHAQNIVNYNNDIRIAITQANNDVTKLIELVREVARKYGFEPKF